jgi:hypothetical protein
MPGMRDFVRQTFNYRNVVTKTTTYTVLATDELIKCNGTFTATLPAINSFQGTTQAKKVYRFDNVSTSGTVTTIAPGTDTVTNVANTIGGKTTYSLKANETVVLSASNGATDWVIASPVPQPAAVRMTWRQWVTLGSGAMVNAFDADGAPANLTVTGVTITKVTASATPSVIYLRAGTSGAADSALIVSITPASVAGGVVGAVVLTNTAVAKGAVIEAYGAAGDFMAIDYTTQQYTD